MARKIKIPNEHLKRFARAEQRRAQNTRSKRKYYLIVCEGAKTEPNYFEGLKQDLPKGVLTAFQIDVEGTGRNTMSLIDEAIRLKGVYEMQTNRPIDKLWTVFDRDSFSANDFNNAVMRCKNATPEIGCAWSNEAFELWYLLHFHYYNNVMSRREYQRLIEENLKPVVGDGYRYQKNSTEMYTLLKEHGSIENAIRNANRLASNYQGREDYANHNPGTMVHKLVEELLSLKDQAH
ncbi:RloB family protein [Pedobacter sp. MC2016-24]|uniref:RloB family protein n=1 Tax=Pedobacter sp. MC2016-24 TaxID=2780090 RepID=UPI00187F2BE0|nr:RloB family protein [Pedobacter sp. MC2016-24]MBE9600714.1 RloB domain-containing protein [Pedobacter sp. MC2016-24]